MTTYEKLGPDPLPFEQAQTIVAAQYELDVRRWALKLALQAARDTGHIDFMDVTASAEHMTRYVLHGDNHGLCPLKSGHA